MATEHRQLFFALDPPAAVRQRIAEVQVRLGLAGRVMTPRNFHITLVFLGRVPAADIGTLSEIAARTPAPVCNIALDRLGWFTRAGVVWLGCSKVPGAMAHLRGQLKERLEERGFSADKRPWIPHVTLYRDLRMRFEKMPFETIGWHCEGYCLMRSGPGPDGVEYRSIGHW